MLITRKENEVEIDFQGGVVYVNQQKPILSINTETDDKSPKLKIINATLYGIPSNKFKRITTLFKIMKIIWKAGDSNGLIQ